MEQLECEVEILEQQKQNKMDQSECEVEILEQQNQNKMDQSECEVEILEQQKQNKMDQSECEVEILEQQKQKKVVQLECEVEILEQQKQKKIQQLECVVEILEQQKQKSYYNCAVDGCLNTTMTNESLSFFRIPPNPEKRAKWARLINREDLIESKSCRARVCEAHFSPEYITKNTSRKLLFKNAFPQLLLPNQKKATKRIQTDNKKADKSVQYDYNLRTNAQVQTPLYLLNDTPYKKVPLCEVKVCRKGLKITKKSEANKFLKLCDKFLTPNLALAIKKQIKNKVERHKNESD